MQVLIEVAEEMRRLAYAPYSRYAVGAALLGASGRVYGGCNVENASFGLTICAERAAVAKAISDGEQEFIAIMVVTEDGGSPCGACRQVLAEFSPYMEVYIAKPDGMPVHKTVAELLPDSFSLRR
ncbi:MAG: cytidine deaminase [Anaerolineae bacterium]|nr:cytidine deaminase [Thermoflexales bacterium]MDW8408146.1 cytidine deaminase [Anaerolineae bacterium]